MKFQDDISFLNIIDQNLKKAITQKHHMNLFQFFIKYSIHHPLSADTSFKFISYLLFKIRHLQNFIPLFFKGP